MEDNKPKNVHVETFADDLAGAIHGNGGGTIKKIIEEERAYEEAKRNLSPKKLVNQLYLYAGIVIFVVALGIFGYVYMGRAKKEVALQPQFTPIVFNDETAFIETSGEKGKLSQEILLKAKSGEMKSGSLKGLYILEGGQVIGFSRLLSMIEANVSLGEASPFQEGFLLGTVSNDNPDLFILLEIKSFTEAFNLLRDWEKKMFFDLQDMFEVSGGEGNYLQTKNFEDGIIENKNARILRDNSGQIALMYVFADDDFVIVSKSERAVREVILRLAGSRVKK